MGHTYKRLYKYIREAKQNALAKKNIKLSTSSNKNEAREEYGAGAKKKLHLMIYFKDEKLIPSSKNNSINTYEVTADGAATTEVSYLNFESLRCLVDNILNPNIHIIHIFASNSTWLNIKKSLVFYMKVDADYLSNKLRHYPSNRKATYKDMFHYSNTLFSDAGQINASEAKTIPLVLIATNKNIQFDNTIREVLRSDELQSTSTRTVHVLLPWDSNYISTNARGVRRQRQPTNNNDSNNNNAVQGVPELKLNGFNFIGLVFKPPLAPSFITNEKSEFYVDDLMSSRAICKLFSEHNYDIASPSLKVHAHRVYGERLKVNPEKIFQVIEPSDSVGTNSNYGYLLS